MLRQHTDLSGVALLLLAFGCLACAAMLWRSSGPHEWLIMMLLNAAMLMVHVLWWPPESAMDTMSPMSHPQHQGDGLTLMHAALALAVVELFLAAVGLFSELAPRRLPLVTDPSMAARPEVGKSRYSQQCE